MRGRITVSIFAVLIVCGLVWAAGGDMGVGTEPLTNGSEAYPWLIEDVNDFDAFAGNSAYWAGGVHTQLMTDIDLAGRTYTTAVIAPDTNSTTQYFQGTQFKGVFDGNGHTLSNLTINQPTKDYIGLFGYVGTGGQVKNLGVEDVNLTGDEYVGGLVGYHYSGSLSNCHATGEARGKWYIGGLVGYSRDGTLTSCYANSLVNGTFWYIGGLVGKKQLGTLTSCYAVGSVSGSSYLGGLVGLNGGTITSSYAASSISGLTGYVGGLVGWNESGMLTSCYATGSVSGGSCVGGLVGLSHGSLTACYATGAVTSSTGDSVGGLAGYSDNAITCFWNMETSGQSGSTGGKGLTTVQMKTMSIYQNAGWTDKGWVMNDGLEYPRLVWENTVGIPIPQPQPVPLWGSGSEQDPYQVWTNDDFVLLSWHVGILNKHISLMTDLDLTGVVFCPIGDLGPFNGVFDGNDNRISNAVLNRSVSDYGIFGIIGYGGQVRNLSIERVNVIGSIFVGGLAGRNQGTLTSCCASGSVSGNSAVGGLVGINDDGTLTSCSSNVVVDGFGNSVGGLAGDHYSGSLSDCYATGSVSGGENVGGLVGENHSMITDCHATGSVDGYLRVGGLVGWNESGTLISCYATGSISAIGQNSVVGGLVGDNAPGIIDQCYATGSVIGNDFVGGLVGLSNAALTSCYATGSVSGSAFVGGLAADNCGTIDRCYATGPVTGNDFVGGLVGGDSPGTLTACFWDTQTSGTSDGVGNADPDPVGVTGKITEEMMTLTTFTEWDFMVDWMMLREGEDYPRLAWQAVFKGDVAGLYGVDMADYAYLANYWGLDDCNGLDDCGRADIDEGGDVGLGDLVQVGGDWLCN